MSNNGGDHFVVPGIAGSMFGPENPEELQAKLAEPVHVTRGELAEMIHSGVMEITGTMSEQFDIQEKMIDKLEITNGELRREITALKELLKKAKSFEAS